MRTESTAYGSCSWFDAKTVHGVRYRIRRISVGRKIELARKVREIGRNVEFLEASGDARERLEAAVLGSEIDRAYLEWGLEAVDGLSIDGEPGTPELVIEKGPMDLAVEILARIKAECQLKDDERKN